MSVRDPLNAGSREIALGLTQALRPALVPGAAPVKRMAAREVAQLLGLPGLDAALALLERFTGSAWPVDVTHLADRITRIAAGAEADAAVTAFYAADSELAAYAAHLQAQDWSDGSQTDEPATATLSLSEQLGDLTIDRPALLEHERITLAVAASLRAALDWLGAGERSAIEAHVQDTALTLTTVVAHEGGIAPAAAVLASVEGSLLPEANRWTLRVPLHATRGSYLLVRQGHLSLALPWHSVARLRMASEEERANLNEPVLAPFVPGIAFAGERPAALLALGLHRAWCVVDRIVWRIVAEPDRDDGGPFASATRSVRLDDGERFWVLPPAWCLRDVTPLQAPPPAPRPRTITAPARVETHEAIEVNEANEAYTPAPMFELLRSQEPEPIAAETLAQLRAQVEEALGRLEPAPPAPPAPPVSPAPPASALSAPDPARVRSPEAQAPHAPGAESSVISAWDALDQLTFESPASAPETRLAPAAEGMPEPAPVAPAPVDDAPAPSGSRIFSARLEVLRPESVQRLDAPVVAPTTPTTPATPPTLVVSSAPPAPVANAPAPQRALLVDDSLVARVFLTRLLERRGFIVEQAADAAECWALLPEQEWAVLMIDVALPDARGRQHMADIVAFATQAGGVPVVALTRDAAEEREALMAGAAASLRKPFESTAVDDLLHLLPMKHAPTPESPR